MNRPLNIKEAKELIEIYRSVSLKEIKDGFRLALYKKDKYKFIPRSEVAAKFITGFGGMLTCTLCTRVGSHTDEQNCNKCIYQGLFNCFRKGEAYDTYEGIRYAETPEEMKEAFKARADFIEKHLKQFD